MRNRHDEVVEVPRKDQTPELSAAREELSILDKLAEALTTIISSLIRQRPHFDQRNENTEVVLHELKYSSLKGYQELAHHSYGRTVIGREIDQRGRPISQFSYRITQANVGYLDAGCFVLARNSPIASKLVTANPGDESEVSVPKGTRVLETAPMACIRIVMTTTAAIKNALDNGSPIQILHRDRDIGPIDTHAVH